MIHSRPVASFCPVREGEETIVLGIWQDRASIQDSKVSAWDVCQITGFGTKVSIRIRKEEAKKKKSR
jgi:hypothetical protein